MREIRGVITAMATPFDAGGGVDEDAARRLARHLVEHGSHGVVVAGTTGESPTLSDSEKLSLLSAVLEEIGGEATVICGTGSNDTAHAAELTRAAAEAGAHAALVVTPYYNKPNRAGLEAHFAAVAEAAPELPIVLYNIPSRVVVNISPELLGQLAQIENVVAVKQANNEELQPIPGLGILAGNDDVFLRTLELGGVGGILVASHIVGPQMREIWDAVQAGESEGARRIQAELAPVLEALAVTSNPIPLKAALEMLGLDSGRMRLPMVPADSEQRDLVRSALESAGLLAAAG
ncbi:MAG: 4-hydroxy-tetrahydrodipicolinate synthase [Solirubrobacterales bacterium]